jgi:hypothetical protein
MDKDRTNSGALVLLDHDAPIPFAYKRPGAERPTRPAP